MVRGSARNPRDRAGGIGFQETSLCTKQGGWQSQERGSYKRWQTHAPLINSCSFQKLIIKLLFMHLTVESIYP